MRSTSGILIISIFSICSFSVTGQNVQKSDYTIYTADLEHFWQAYDALPTAKHHTDSVWLIQTLYLDRATEPFKKFIRKRDLTAENYVRIIGAYPKFWTSIRPKLESLYTATAAIDSLFSAMHKAFPDFIQPDICFAVSCLNTGGTTAGNTLLLGSEIIMTDSTVNRSELNDWLKSVTDDKSDLIAYLAHESMHIQQHGVAWWEMGKLIKYKSLSLLNTSVLEGTADFLTDTYLNVNINAHLQAYGLAHFDTLYTEFVSDHTAEPYAIYDWLYNGNSSLNRPADLGYFMGYMIAATYYYSSPDKTAAVKSLLKNAQYKKIAAPFLASDPHQILQLVVKNSGH